MLVDSSTRNGAAEIGRRGEWHTSQQLRFEDAGHLGGLADEADLGKIPGNELDVAPAAAEYRHSLGHKGHARLVASLKPAT